LTLGICLVIAILPVIILSILLVQEGAALYNNIESGNWTSGYMAQFKHSLPPYFQHLLDRFGMGELNGLREKIVKASMQGSQVLASRRSVSARAHSSLWSASASCCTCCSSFCAMAPNWRARYAPQCRWKRPTNAVCS
jgi:hypothetical protein